MADTVVIPTPESAEALGAQVVEPTGRDQDFLSPDDTADNMTDYINQRTAEGTDGIVDPLGNPVTSADQQQQPESAPPSTATPATQQQAADGPEGDQVQTAQPSPDGKETEPDADGEVPSGKPATQQADRTDTDSVGQVTLTEKALAKRLERAERKGREEVETQLNAEKQRSELYKKTFAQQAQTQQPQTQDPPATAQPEAAPASEPLPDEPELYNAEKWATPDAYMEYVDDWLEKKSQQQTAAAPETQTPSTTAQPTQPPQSQQPTAESPEVQQWVSNMKDMGEILDDHGPDGAAERLHEGLTDQFKDIRCEPDVLDYLVTEVPEEDVSLVTERFVAEPRVSRRIARLPSLDAKKAGIQKIIAEGKATPAATVDTETAAGRQPIQPLQTGPNNPNAVNPLADTDNMENYINARHRQQQNSGQLPFLD